MDFNDMFDLATGNSTKYIECPHCNGYGSSLKESSARCTQCNGSGLIKKEE